MFAYCNNSPICFEDSTGTYRATVLGDKEYVAPLVPTTVGAAHAYSLSARNSGHSFRLFGIASNVGVETITSFDYHFFYTCETGVGYNKAFDSNSLFTAFITHSTDMRTGWAFSFGIDGKTPKGYGYSFEIGTNVACSFHLRDTSFEIGWDPAGHTYFKSTYATENGGYTYKKFSINGHECAATVIIGMYASYALPAVVYAFYQLVQVSSELGG